MERKINESEQWLATTLKSIGDAVIATDTGGFVVFMNPVAEVLTGWKQKEAVGKPLKNVFNIIDQKTGKQAEDLAKRILREGVKVGLAKHKLLIAKDGTKRPIDDSGAPIRDDKGNITGGVFVFRDITERKRVEARLRESEEEFRTIFERANDGILVADLETKRFLTGNTMVCEMLGCSPEEIKNLKVTDIHPKEDLPDVLDKFEELARGEYTLATDIPVKRKDGSIFYADINASHISFYGKPYIMGIFRDVTEQKQVEEKLRASEARYRSVVDNINIGIAMINSDMEILAINNQMKKWFPDIDTSQKPICYKFFNKPPIDEICPNCPAHKTLQDGEAHELIRDMLIGDEIRIYRIVSSPIKDKAGKIIAAVELLEDITERKRMQDSLLKSERQLRTLSSSILSAQEQERKRISRELHDDFGQILTAVLLDISRAEKQETIVSSSSYSFLERIRIGIQEALQRVRSLSAILRPGVLDQLGLKAAVISFLEEMQGQTGLKIIEEMQVDHSNIPESVSIAIYRILQEATTNIIKHSAAKQVIVKLRSDFQTISISIKDDGQGFNPELLPVDKGLGLLGMKERTEWLGGIFKIESAHGRGTSIYAEFPLSSRK